MKKPTIVDLYLNEIINYGGEFCTRAEAILDMERNGQTQGEIDRWLQGYELGEEIRARHKQPSLVPGVFVSASRMHQFSKARRRKTSPTVVV